MKVLQKIARTYVDIGEDSPALEIAIETLRAGISREQKSLLLKIIDEYSDRIDYAADRNFKYGFRMGVHLGRELFSQNKKVQGQTPVSSSSSRRARRKNAYTGASRRKCCATVLCSSGENSRWKSLLLWLKEIPFLCSQSCMSCGCSG